MTANPQLTTDLQHQVRLLEDDLHERVESDPATAQRWRTEHDRAVAAERTAWSWQAWRDDRVDQTAVAWVLLTVFVRFCEDNDLVKPVWIEGAGSRRQEALDAQLEYFRTHPEHTDREWLSQPIDYLGGLPATQALVDEHNPLHTVAPSGDAATRLLAFWRERDEDGTPQRDLTDPDRSTRFLGDLYQDLSQHAKDTYALLQTPEFVEEFILDRTLTPALDERPLDGFRMIDPACGSGHFLFGTFHRLLDRWHRHAPGLETRARVQAALDAIHGVDINPFAVAIARFRLTVAALDASGIHRLEDAPAFSYHLAAGDSLLHGRDQFEIDYGPQQDPDSVASGFAYSAEDLRALREILQPGRYDVVVGNPPYITVRDAALNRQYRARYPTCHRRYALTVPFMERFLQLAIPESDTRTAGWAGQITSNSFMKRDFGAPLIETFLSRRDIRLIADTSGAYIPGHNREGTPTVIIVLRNYAPISSSVPAVLRVRGEMSGPSEAANGTVWRSIVDHVDEIGYEDNWISVVELKRSLLYRHPWSLTGGGAVELGQRIRANSSRTVESLGVVIGRTTHTGEDDAFFAPLSSFVSRGLAQDAVPVVLGAGVRDYQFSEGTWTLFPYDQATGRPVEPSENLKKYLWPLRTLLSARTDYQRTIVERGLR